MILLIKVILAVTSNKHTRCLIRTLIKKIFLYSYVYMNICVVFFFLNDFLLSSETAANVFLFSSDGNALIALVLCTSLTSAKSFLILIVISEM